MPDMLARLTLTAALLVLPGLVAAHSAKEVVVPAENATVAGSPPQIAMSFDSAMRITQIRLVDAAGKAWALARTDRMAPVTEFVATPESLPPGGYTVEWRGIALDGHTMEGAWSFTVK
jgi:copper resistance protein C